MSKLYGIFTDDLFIYSISNNLFFVSKLHSFFVFSTMLISLFHFNFTVNGYLNVDYPTSFVLFNIISYNLSVKPFTRWMVP